MQLNIKLSGTLTPLLLSIHLNFKPYLRMRLWNILYNIFHYLYSQIGLKIQLNG
jgi:hypothetical protein